MSEWTIKEQRQLDAALEANPKQAGEDAKGRWQKISSGVEGRSLKECVARYKTLRSRALNQAAQALPPAPTPEVSSINTLPSKLPAQRECQTHRKKPDPRKEHQNIDKQQKPRQEQLQKKSARVAPGEKKKQKFKQPQKQKSHETDHLVTENRPPEAARERWMIKQKAKNSIDGSGARKSSDSGASPKSSIRCWWHSLTDFDDPISLEPISQLQYPPFEIQSDSGDASASGRSAINYFDGNILASYIVSTSNFINPLSRQPLNRDDCLRLDNYLKQHELACVGVTEAYDLFQHVGSGGRCATGTGRSDQLRREAALMFRSLFTVDTSTGLDSARNTSPGNGGDGTDGGEIGCATSPLRVINPRHLHGLAADVLAVDDIASASVGSFVSNGAGLGFKGNSLLLASFGAYGIGPDQVDAGLYAELFPSLANTVNFGSSGCNLGLASSSTITTKSQRRRQRKDEQRTGEASRFENVIKIKHLHQAKKKSSSGAVTFAAAAANPDERIARAVEAARGAVAGGAWGSGGSAARETAGPPKQGSSTGNKKKKQGKSRKETNKLLRAAVFS